MAAGRGGDLGADAGSCIDSDILTEIEPLEGGDAGRRGDVVNCGGCVTDKES